MHFKHCNIYNPAPPDCPFCTGSIAVQMVPFGFTSVAGVLGTHFFRRKRGSRMLRDIGVGLACALITAFVLSWIYAVALQYPNFVFF